MRTSVHLRHLVRCGLLEVLDREDLRLGGCGVRHLGGLDGQTGTRHESRCLVNKLSSKIQLAVLGTIQVYMTGFMSAASKCTQQVNIWRIHRMFNSVASP